MNNASVNNRLMREHYPHFESISTRWSDNDVYGHVNNVVYYSYFDSVVNRYLIEHAGLNIDKDDVVGFVVNSACDYFAPIAYPEKIDVGLRVIKLGNKSVEYGLAIFKHKEQQAVAIGAFTHVFVSRSAAKSTSIPSKIRAALEQLLPKKFKD